ncbi:MAG TPA: hypothetical protein VJ836_01320 [Candidatus Saccharimonadales bacterium]|nr:hypothetical protein [Candidatus Saccharimonadales bacterium]
MEYPNELQLVISRRNLLIAGGLGAVGAALGGCEDVPDEPAPDLPPPPLRPTEAPRERLEVSPFNTDKLGAPYIGVSTGDRTDRLNSKQIDAYMELVAKYGNVTRLDFGSSVDRAVHMDAAYRYKVGIVALFNTSMQPEDIAETIIRHGAQNGGPIMVAEVGGNEQNNEGFSIGGADVANFTQRFIEAAEVVRSVAPRGSGVEIISGGLSPAVTRGLNIAPVTFMDRFLDGLERSNKMWLLDGVGMHPYDYPSTKHTEPWSAWHQMAGGPNTQQGERYTLRDVLERHDGAPNKIYITEVGATTTGERAVSQRVQRAIVKHAITAPVPGIETPVRIVFTLHDDPNQQDPSEVGFGIHKKLAGRYMLDAIAAARR